MRWYRVQSHFSSDRTQNVGFAADMPLDGWVEEEMHVPGIITARDETFGASPAMFTIDLFGREPAVLQEIADNLSLFPMERGLDSARSAVTHGLRPERVSASFFIGMVRVWSQRYDRPYYSYSLSCYCYSSPTTTYRSPNDVR